MYAWRVSVDYKSDGLVTACTDFFSLLSSHGYLLHCFNSSYHPFLLFPTFGSSFSMCCCSFEFHRPTFPVVMCTHFGVNVAATLESALLVDTGVDASQ